MFNGIIMKGNKEMRGSFIFIKDKDIKGRYF